MKYTTGKEHRFFFETKGWIEFEQLLSPEQIKVIEENAKKSFSKSLSSISSERLFLEGRDLWRKQAALKKIIYQQSLARIFSELVEKRPLRIVYDQLWISRNRFDRNESLPYQKLLTSETSLQEFSSFQGILGGCMLCLANGEKAIPEDEPHSIFPLNSGSGIYFKGDLPISFEFLIKNPGFHYLLIVYGSPFTTYAPQNTDPLIYFPKSLGYQIGERLTEKTHPIVIS